MKEYFCHIRSIDATKNNGQLGKIESFIGANKQASQRFGYDELGRLKEAREYKQGDNAQLTYKQKFDFDRFGNLYRKAASNPTTGQQNPLPFTPIEDSDISKSTNRFATQTTYDDAGQVISDTKFRNLGFAYDANGRQVKATKANTPDAWTVYDALGNRVATKINNIWQYVIYDAFGKLVAEYGAASEGLGGVKYIQQDWQGSVRAVTNNNGFVVARTDHQAFGGEIVIGVGLRSIEQGYSVDKVAKQGYGSTENDVTTNQQHTGFRKLETQAGRWTSPDPYNGSSDVGTPQSWNKFAYVENDPVNLIDPSGLDALSDAVAAASELLKFKPCKNVFKKQNPQSLLRRTKIRTTVNQPALYTSKGIIKWHKGWLPGIGGVTLVIGRDKGIYFSPTGKIFGNIPVGIGFGIELSAPEYGALAILHELAHVAGVIPDDALSTNQSQRNSRGIYIRCFVLNPARNREPIETTQPNLGGFEILSQPPISYLEPRYGDAADWAFFWLDWLSRINVYWTDEPVFVDEEDA